MIAMRALITGISGTGKSSVVRELVARGYRAVDADEGDLSHEIEVSPDEDTGIGGGRDWVWREDRVRALLDADPATDLFLSGCAPNQGRFHADFDHIVLLSAPAATIVERLATRTDNPFGKAPEEVGRVLRFKETVEPLLRRAAGHEIDTSAPLAEVVDDLLRRVGLVSGAGAGGDRG